ncbi:Predicted arabinose efflux permease, MFS family [Halogranum gelatinilyticum]|uniref:Predicted arabinose efflux permease, MFS family n=1 Tax=Halogranum gelatinilyticum TaxID=660521 RepID=A0A1G9QJN6_9EURY|nr:MFS transporter [Halogranum gelatinilyticum]SDM10495.1 Predicted arabinose efflux permease, MFS family [Halogranum gelatinilyticum]
MSRGRLFGTLCSLVFLVNLARVVFAPLLNELLSVFPTMGEATAGLIATLVWVGSASLRIPTGWLLTRVARHRVVLGTGTILTVAAAFTASATSVPMLGVGALLMGLSSGAYFVAANPLVSELFPERVGRAIGIHGMASQLAAVIAAPLVTLVVLSQYGWRLAFWAICVAAALVTVALYLAARSTDLPDAGGNDRDLVGAARKQWRVILLGIVVLGFTGFVWQGLFNFYELYMLQKDLPPATAKNLLTVVFAAGVPAFFFSGRLADRFPHVPYLLGIVAVFVGCLFILTRVEAVLPVVAVTAVLGYVIHSLFPALDTYLLDTFPDDSRASAYAVYSGGMMVVQATGSVAVGTLREAGFAYDLIFTCFAAALAVLVVGLVGFQRAGKLPS